MASWASDESLVEGRMIFTSTPRLAASVKACRSAFNIDPASASKIDPHEKK
jgi:hypothetical protein